MPEDLELLRQIATKFMEPFHPENEEKTIGEWRKGLMILLVAVVEYVSKKEKP